MTDSPTIRETMSTRLVTLRPEQSIHAAIHVLLENRFSGAPVVDAEGRLVGVLSNRDCLGASFGASYHQDLGGTVADHMSSPVETLTPDRDVIEVAEMFVRGRYRRYPVVEGGRLVGLVSRHDILKALDAAWPHPPG